MEIPPAGQHVWYIFLELSGQRTGNGFGPNPIQFDQLVAWQQVMQRRLKPWEVRAILSMDRAFLVKSAELADTDETTKVSDEPVTAELFDRLFG